MKLVHSGPAHRKAERGAKPERQWARTVHHGGRSYVATAAMAGIFEAHARDVIANGDTELVPLLHRGGVDLLLISPTTRFTIVDIELGLTQQAAVPLTERPTAS